MKQKIKRSLKRRNEKGYTLFYTLIIMAIMLSLSAYLFTKVDLYKMLVVGNKYAANTYLAAETMAIGEGERIAGRFNKLSGSGLMQEEEVFQILSEWEEEYCDLYYTAKTCMKVTKSLFHTQSKDGYFYQSNQVKPKYIIQGDQESQELVLEVESRTHPYNMQDVSNPLKKDLVNLEKIKKALRTIDKGIKRSSEEAKPIKKQEILKELKPQFNILKEEMLTKPLYEVESIARIKSGFSILSSQTVYLTLELNKKATSCENKVEDAVYYFTLPYELEAGYLKAKKNSN